MPKVGHPGVEEPLKSTSPAPHIVHNLVYHSMTNQPTKLSASRPSWSYLGAATSLMTVPDLSMTTPSSYSSLKWSSCSQGGRGRGLSEATACVFTDPLEFEKNRVQVELLSRGEYVNLNRGPVQGLVMMKYVNHFLLQ